MKYVKLNKQVNNRQAGEIIRVDDGSAASLVEKKVGEIVESRDEAEVLRSAARRGNVIVQQVADADDPNAVVGEPVEDDAVGEPAEVVDGEGEKHTGELPAAKFTEKNSHGELVNAVVDAKKATAEEAQKLTKAELLTKLGQPETPPESNPPA